MKAAQQQLPRAVARSSHELCAAAAEEAPEYLDSIMKDPFAEAAAAQPALRSPRIFVYDLPAAYNTRMVQYRVVKVKLSCNMVLTRWWAYVEAPCPGWQ